MSIVPRLGARTLLSSSAYYSSCFEGVSSKSLRSRAPKTNTFIARMTTKSHYEAHTAESYESAFFYEEGAYTKRLCDLVVEKLCLKQEASSARTLLDIGGGTGNFTRMLTRESTMDLNAIVVDPFLSESSTAKDGTNELSFVKASAESFMESQVDETDQWWRQGYHQILMKEVVHHFQAPDRTKIFKGMWNGLAERVTTKQQQAQIPSVLIITRPQREIDYPLWAEAREVWAANQPHVDELVQDLKTAGFATVDYSIEGYPCAIELKRWQSMVKQRFWSTFSNFSDADLEAACKTIEESERDRVDAHGRIQFEDRLVFIVAHR